MSGAYPKPILLTHQTSPSSPPSNHSFIYPKSDGRFYSKSPNGTEYLLGLPQTVYTAWRTSTQPLVVSGLNYTKIQFNQSNNAEWDTTNHRFTPPFLAWWDVRARISVGAASGERFIGALFTEDLSLIEVVRGTDIVPRGADRVTVMANGKILAGPSTPIDFRVQQVNGSARMIDAGQSICRIEVALAAVF